MSTYAVLLADIRIQEITIRASGAVASPGQWLDTNTARGKQYARLRSNSGPARSLGRVNSAQHRDWQQRIRRRDQIAELTRRALKVQSWIDTPIE